MSHITTVNVEYDDLDAVKEAGKALGLEFRENQKTYGWFESFVGDSNRYGDLKPEEMGRCEHALAVKGSGPGGKDNYEIGIIRTRDGKKWRPVYDSWGPGRKLETLAGRDLVGLKQEYAVALAIKKASKLKRKGWSVERKAKDAAGRVRVVLRKR